MTIRSLLLIFLAATLCFAQSERGSITGIITDASGANIANAPVNITNQATNTAEHIFTSDTDITLVNYRWLSSHR